MLTMTQSDLPQYPFPTSEEMKSATERLTNFWIGACSPMWVPFFAATSFGVSAWMLTGAAARGATGSDLYKDLPKGFVDMMSLRQSWYKASEDAAHVMEDVNEAVREAAVSPVMAAIKAEDAMIGALSDTVTPAKTPAPVETPTPAKAVSIEDVLPDPVVEPAFEPVPVIRAAPKRRPAPRK